MSLAGSDDAETTDADEEFGVFGQERQERQESPEKLFSFSSAARQSRADPRALRASARMREKKEATRRARRRA